MLCLLSYRAADDSRPAGFCDKQTYLDRFDGDCGPVCVYSVPPGRRGAKAERHLQKTVSPLFTAKHSIPKEYLSLLCAKKAVQSMYLSHIKNFFLDEPLPFDTAANLCRAAAVLYVRPDCLPAPPAQFYKSCGAVPTVTGFAPTVPTLRDFLCDATLPESLLHICPPDFSPTLFAALLYTQNGVFFG